MATRISTYLHGNLKSALAKTDALIKAQPKNPYFQELRGDILLKANKPKDAADAYAKAVSLDPGKSGLLQVSYGQALMAVGDPASLKKAVTQLKHRPRARQGKRRRLPLSGPGLWRARRHPAGRPCDGRRLFLRRRLQGCEDLRDARAAEDEARRAGLGSRAGHHQLQDCRQEEVNLFGQRSRRRTTAREQARGSSDHEQGNSVGHDQGCRRSLLPCWPSASWPAGRRPALAGDTPQAADDGSVGRRSSTARRSRTSCATIC